MFNRSVNKVVLIGNLGKEPEICHTQDGVTVANLVIATKESWKDKSTGEWQESTEWHRISAFNRLGELCAQYIKKGNRIYVEGRIKTRKWKAQDGSDRYSTEIIASDIELLDAKNSNDFTTSKPSPIIPTSIASDKVKSSYTATNDYSNIDYDDDIPF